MPTLFDRTAYQALLDNRSILIVDDEEPIRRLLGYLLQSHGYTVALAGNDRLVDFGIDAPEKCRVLLVQHREAHRYFVLVALAAEFERAVNIWPWVFDSGK